MPSLLASSAIVIPGCAPMWVSASAPRLPVPLRRPGRRLAPFLVAGLVAALVAVAVAVLFLEPRGRPGPLRLGLVAGGVDADAPFFAVGMPASASDTVCSWPYSSTIGLSSASRSSISRRFSARKSVTGNPSLSDSRRREHIQDAPRDGRLFR